MRWNRPHKVSAAFDLRFDQQTPSRWLRNWGLNVFVQGLSGRPYTPANERGDASGAPNSKNAKFQTTTDLRVNRWFQLGKQKLDISLAATNIFNAYVIYRVDPMTGLGRVWGQGSYDPNNPFLDVNDYVRTSQVDDPSNYGPGSQWRLSVDYDF